MRAVFCVVGVMAAVWFGLQASMDLALTGFPDSHVTDYDAAAELPKRILMWTEFAFVPIFLLLALPRFGVRAPVLALAALALVVVIQLVGVPWYFGTHLGLDNGIGAKLRPTMGTVLIPIPDRDFDPTEVAVSWQVLRTEGHQVVFATESGTPGVADDIMVTGRGLDLWSTLPVLGAITLVGRALRANKDARRAYQEMQRSPEYQNPTRWADTTLDGIDALLLPGGHRARGMRSYIDSDALHRLVVDAFARKLKVAAICHGVLLAARSVDPSTGRSVLYGRRTTALTWALERTAWRLSRLTRFWDRDYYRTYSEEPGQPSGYMSVQSEVTRALENPSDFCDVEKRSPHYRAKTSGMARDTATDSKPAFVVDDGDYVSARWPGDTHTFAHVLSQKL